MRGGGGGGCGGGKKNMQHTAGRVDLEDDGHVKVLKVEADALQVDDFDVSQRHHREGHLCELHQAVDGGQHHHGLAVGHTLKPKLPVTGWDREGGRRRLRQQHHAAMSEWTAGGGMLFDDVANNDGSHGCDLATQGNTFSPVVHLKGTSHSSCRSGISFSQCS